MKTVNIALGSLMILGSCGHTVGTFLGYPIMSQIFVWSLGTSLAGALLGALNILRAGRLHDTALAAITAVGTAGFALLALAFGKSIANPADPRAMGNFGIAAVLVIFNLVALGRRWRPVRRTP
jgi:hypothetical protein